MGRLGLGTQLKEMQMLSSSLAFSASGANSHCNHKRTYFGCRVFNNTLIELA